MPKRILVVDLNSEDLSTLQQYLETEGYVIEEASDCSEACQRVAEGNIDLMVLDVSSGHERYQEACSRLHSNRKTENVPIIAIVGSEDEETEGGEEAVAVGADDFVDRPLKRSDVLIRTRMLMRYKEVNEDLRQRNQKLEDINQELAARNQELEQGMEMAHRLQETLLPQQYPAVENVSFNHLYTPADVIGGDIFQIAGLPDDRAAIFLSDVSGHGIRAALVTSILKAVFEHIYLEDKNATQILQDLNSRFRNIMGGLSPHIFATGFLLMVDGKNRSITVASAGHVCPLLISKDNMSCEPLGESNQTGPALGFFHDPEFPAVEKQLSTGDILLGFTDGVYEVMNENGEIYGLERMRQLIARNARLIPRDLIQKVVRETEEWRGSRKRPDDVCMVAVEVH
jgi:sigma-B regulation protein RsbU (phosphoserine phosphatase)